MYIIKFGGSVITDKSKENSFKKDIVKNLSEQLKKAGKQIILVHGAGSYGHILAKKYDLNNGFKNKDQLEGFSKTHAMVQKLSSFILDILHEKKINAVSIAPHSIMKLHNHKPYEFNYNIFKDYLKNGFIPVTFGDVVLDKKLVFSICSGDLLIQMLSQHFKPEKVIFVMDEDGLYTSNPKEVENAEFIDKATVSDLENMSTSFNKYDDVTRGMKGKIDTIKNIASFGIDAVLLNGNKSDRLYDVLVGNEVKQTLIFGEK